MNGIFLAAACLGALVTIALAEPRMQAIRQEQLQQEQSAIEPMHSAYLPVGKTPGASTDIEKGAGSMTTRTVVELDPATGQDTATEERVIAFHD